MAVFSIEIFASTCDDAAPMSSEQQFCVRQRFTHALALLNDSRSTLLLTCDVTPYDTGALISGLCMADTGETAAEDIAEQLAATVNGSAERDRWVLRTGVTLVISSDS